MAALEKCQLPAAGIGIIGEYPVEKLFLKLAMPL